MNGDGNDDVLGTGYDGSVPTPTQRRTSLYLSNGDGSFQEVNPGIPPLLTADFAVGDLNGDATLDVIAAGSALGGTAVTSVYLGDGAGGFSEVSRSGLPTVGVRPTIELRDVNGDANLDALLIGGGSTALYFGDGTGGFSDSGISLPSVFSGTGAFGDITNDGNVDLVFVGEIAGFFNERLVIYQGDGSGGFSDAGLDVEGVDGGLALGRIDGNGALDVVITGSSPLGGAVTRILLNDGSGGLTEASTSAFDGILAQDVVLGDVNDDAVLDLVLTGQVEGDSDTPVTKLFSGDGTGGFAEVDAGLTDVGGIPPINSAISVEAFPQFGDIDADSDLDLVLAGVESITPGREDVIESSLRVYVNRTLSSGSNDAPQIGAIETPPPALAAGRTLTLRVDAGDPDGDRVSLTTPQSPAGVSIADAGNGVGELTITPPSSQTGQTISVTVEVSDGGLSNQRTVAVDVSDYAVSNRIDRAGGRIAAGFFNADTFIDFVVPTSRDNTSGDEETAFYFSDQQGGYTRQNTTFAGAQFDRGKALVVDANNDDFPDVFVFGSLLNTAKNVLYLVNDGFGNFTETSTPIDGNQFGDAATADFDGDGNADVVISGEPDSFSPEQTVVYFGDGTGGFPRQTTLQGLSRSSLAVGDLNNDGNVDLVASGRDGTSTGVTRVYLGDGQGGFMASGAQVAGGIASGLDLGDVDRDGNLDLVITNADQGSGQGRGTLLYLGDGAGGFTLSTVTLDPIDFGLGSGARSSATFADFSGDGALDLVVAGPDDNFQPSATLYEGDGQGGFTDVQGGLAGLAPGAALDADADGDGDLDLVMTGTSLGSGRPSLRTYKNNLDTFTSTQPITTDSPVFAGGGVLLFFNGLSSEGSLTVTRFETRPAPTTAVTEDNVAPVRFVVEAGETLAFSEAALLIDLAFIDGVTDPNEIVIYRRDGAGPFEALSTSVDNRSGSPFLETIVTGFSEFILASNTNPLPVELSGLEATAAGETVQLSWATASETDNAGFTVERSTDGTAFTSVGFVEGAGTTTEPQRYRFTDAGLPFGADAVTYRLRQVDLDGTATHSTPVTVRREAPAAVALHAVFPNPSPSGHATLRYELPTDTDVRIAVYDVLGREVAVPITRRHRAGRVETRLQLAHLGSGLYFVRLQAGEAVRTQRLTIAR
jgi:hypothetical protein